MRSLIENIFWGFHCLAENLICEITLNVKAKKRKKKVVESFILYQIYLSKNVEVKNINVNIFVRN